MSKYKVKLNSDMVLAYLNFSFTYLGTYHLLSPTLEAEILQMVVIRLTILETD